MFSKEWLYQMQVFALIILSCCFVSQANAEGEYDFDLSPFKPFSVVLLVGPSYTTYHNSSLHRVIYKNGTTTTRKANDFKQQFYTPMGIGLETAYAFTPQYEAFVDATYYGHSGRDEPLIQHFTPLQIIQQFDSSSQFGAYIGLRRYFETFRMNNLPYIRPRFFVGAKLGVVRFSSVDVTSRYFGVASIPPARNATQYNPSTNFSAGAQFGFDYRSAATWGVGLKGEILATGGRKGNLLNNPAPFPNIQIANTGTVLQLPLMVYVKYYPPLFN